ncbi:hypothetical protein J7J59_04555, partial [Candidatus Aerophobetes bacterium]|nr:hypothetical protein [Candidatus Aerophobetes bacterium]
MDKVKDYCFLEVWEFISLTRRRRAFPRRSIGWSTLTRSPNGGKRKIYCLRSEATSLNLSRSEETEQ